MRPHAKRNRAALSKAIELAGGQSALAEALGDPVRQGHVWAWLNRTADGVPADIALQIEQRFGIESESLRSDLEWHTLSDGRKVWTTPAKRQKAA